MGFWSETKINNRVLYGTKNHIEQWFIESIFNPYGQKKKVEAQNLLMQAEDYQLITVVDNVLDRLKVLGYKIEDIRNCFDSAKSIEIGKLEEFMELSSFPSPEYHFYINDNIELGITFWKNATLEEFLFAIKNIFTKNIKSIPSLESFLPDYSSMLSYLQSNDEYLIYKLPFGDPLKNLAVILSQLPGEWEVIQDYSSLIDGGYITDPITLNGYEEKVIILTEGISDIEILEPCLNLLYPHLSDLFNFMDFRSFKSPGSASSLVNIIKAFAGAGIKNTIVALFDNDTAGRQAYDQISQLNMPHNIRILTYPDIESASNYPTIGPNGGQNMNINGLAGSIELYTGEDILRDEQKKFVPVQWTGYNSKMQAYQGEILFKDHVQKKFKEKLKQASIESKHLDTQDWNGIKSIFTAIFETVENNNARGINL